MDVKSLFHDAYKRYQKKLDKQNQIIDSMPIKQRLELIIECITGEKTKGR